MRIRFLPFALYTGWTGQFNHFLLRTIQYSTTKNPRRREGPASQLMHKLIPPSAQATTWNRLQCGESVIPRRTTATIISQMTFRTFISSPARHSVRLHHAFASPGYHEVEASCRQPCAPLLLCSSAPLLPCSPAFHCQSPSSTGVAIPGSCIPQSAGKHQRKADVRSAEILDEQKTSYSGAARVK